MALPKGKVPLDILRDVVFKNLGARRSEVRLGPSAGVDGAIIDVGEKSLVVSADPITGALERIGWLSVNVNANDIATFGVEPAFLLSVILLPENTGRETVESISTQMSAAATELGMAIVGGHCETTPGLANPIVVGCAMGLTERGNYVTAAGAKLGDKIVLTKSAGIEGTAILASDREDQLRNHVGRAALDRAKEFYRQISIVKDATVAFKSGGVHAMHDPTEGGVAGALHEMADASGLGVKIIQNKIRVQPETAEICRFFGVDPLRLIASGSLLIAVEAEHAKKTVKTLLDNSVPAEVIGEFVSDPEQRLIVHVNGRTERLVRPVADELWRALQSQPKSQ